VLQVQVFNLISSSRTLVTSSHELGAPYFYVILFQQTRENTEAQVKKYIENQNAESV
jgi:formyltetrahydrofolate hydrolase